jgi:diguanylate cyclase (GGDEF)-like protein
LYDPAELQAKLKTLSDAYALQLPEKLGQIDQAFTRLPAEGWNEQGFQTFFSQVHGLIGSGKAFGFATLSDVARNLETHLDQFAQTKTSLNSQQRGLIIGLLQELHQAANHRDPAFADTSGLIAIFQSGQEVTPPRRIFLVEEDRQLADALKIQLGYYGYQVSVFNTLQDFRLAMQPNTDVIVLIDVAFPANPQGGVNVMSEIQRGRVTPLPVVFISAHDDLATRLGAARTGAVAFLAKPVHIGTLIDKLDNLTSPKPLTPYRVMIVDDSVALTAYHAAVLEQGGISVKTVNDPTTVIDSLMEFSPDLILIDLYMPECNGTDLSKVIRQIDAFVSIPIVFLSSENDLDKQLSAMGLGGDDFLTKPIQPQHLISSVTTRIRRSLKLRSFMVRDSLTGLLNHTAIKDMLHGELAWAIRQKKSLSFAMVDIDDFKQVNDRYGHLAGDSVIKSLARLLKQRLRSSDLIGRYGGEEYAIVLIDADRATSMKVLDNIRNDFSQLLHLADGKEFRVTFSCGIADASQFPEATLLNDAADKALYKAKQAGRNQVFIADNS